MFDFRKIEDDQFTRLLLLGLLLLVTAAMFQQVQQGDNRISEFTKITHPKNVAHFNFLIGLFAASFFNLFSFFQYSCQQTNVLCKTLPMTGFELRIAGIGSHRSTNWATTLPCFFKLCFKLAHSSIQLTTLNYLSSLPKSFDFNFCSKLSLTIQNKKLFYNTS